VTTTTITILVSGMHCTSCSILIDETLEEIDGVTSASTNLRRETTTVTYDRTRTSAEDIAAEIISLGYFARSA
jgi:copper chaperone CopZ